MLFVWDWDLRWCLKISAKLVSRSHTKKSVWIPSICLPVTVGSQMIGSVLLSLKLLTSINVFYTIFFFGLSFDFLRFQENYIVPLVSVSCWHVHCEECWLRTLVSTDFITRSLPFRCCVVVLMWIFYHDFFFLNWQGAKKLCPQCNMITSPSDLRRIYLWRFEHCHS